jgi:hypothetical protein
VQGPQGPRGQDGLPGLPGNKVSLKLKVHVFKSGNVKRVFTYLCFAEIWCSWILGLMPLPTVRQLNLMEDNNKADYVLFCAIKLGSNNILFFVMSGVSLFVELCELYPGRQRKRWK